MYRHYACTCVFMFMCSMYTLDPIRYDTISDMINRNIMSYFIRFLGCAFCVQAMETVMCFPTLQLRHQMLSSLIRGVDRCFFRKWAVLLFIAWGRHFLLVFQSTSFLLSLSHNLDMTTFVLMVRSFQMTGIPKKRPKKNLQGTTPAC